MASPLKACVFLDRDGVINELLPGKYVKHWNEFRFREGVLTGIAKLSQRGYAIFIITNQQGIGKQLMTEIELNQIHVKMRLLIEQAGGRLSGIYHCPHLQSDNCRCRKPGRGMIDEICKQHEGIIHVPWILLGDSPSDLELGNSICAQTFGMRHEHNAFDDWSNWNVECVDSFSTFVDKLMTNL